MKVQPLIKANYSLAESPVWDPQSQTLYFTDIIEKKIYSYHWKSRKIQSHELPFMVGAIGLTKTKGLILATSQGFYFYSPENKTRKFIAHPEKDHPDNRFNDGKCDPWGCFWAGSMNYDAKTKSASLYRVDPGGNFKIMLSDLTISNGLAWNAQLNRMYFIDTPSNQVMSYDYQKNDSYLSQPQICIKNQKPGVFDGMTIDETGKLYIAKFKGNSVEIHDPQNPGNIEIINLPVSLVTSCAFGGPDNNILFITTASFMLSKEQKSKEALAGSIFYTELNVQGQATAYFGSNSR